MFTRIFRIGSDPVRLWRGTVGFHLGHLLEVGTYVDVSSPHLRGYGDSYGVSSGVGMVQSVRPSLTGEGVEVELLHYGFLGAGWNVAAEVAAITNTNTIGEQPHIWARAIPTGVTRYDVEFFSVGDGSITSPRATRMLPRHTIASISGNEII